MGVTVILLYSHTGNISFKIFAVIVYRMAYRYDLAAEL